jgi:hypothetical protein
MERYEDALLIQSDLYYQIILMNMGNYHQTRTLSQHVYIFLLSSWDLWQATSPPPGNIFIPYLAFWIQWYHFQVLHHNCWNQQSLHYNWYQSEDHEVQSHFHSGKPSCCWSVDLHKLWKSCSQIFYHKILRCLEFCSKKIHHWFL